MRFEFIVALRYLKAKRKQAVVSLITAISVIGVAAGVAALVIALAINSGFRQDLQDKLLGAQAHITLMRSDRQGIADYMEIVRRVEQVDGVIAAAPALYQGVLLSNGYQDRGVYLKGIIPELEARRSDVFDRMTQGRLDPLGERSILIGNELAGMMGSFVGDEMRVVSTAQRVTPAGLMPRNRLVEVAGIFDSGLYDYDIAYVYAPLAAVQSLSEAGDVVHGIEIQIANPDQSDMLGPRLVEAAGGGLAFEDWKQQNTAIFQALKLERLVMFITIGLIVIVASLNIVVTLVMMVMEKTRDIAVLMSMGATRDNIRRVFVAQGVIIGVIGTALGLAIGNIASYLADTYRWVSLSADVYAISYVPFRPSWVDSGTVAVAAIVISYLATIYPSRSASRLQPVEALRYE